MLPVSVPSTSPRSTASPIPRQGLRRNWRQFWLLVVVNAFVGGMVGLERAVLPLVAEREFGVAARTAALSFIVGFGLVKALTNFVAGRGFDRMGRKPLLVAGWLAGAPVPFLLYWAPSWNWVIAANVLLGINQGLCWSATVVMKIDLVGPNRRGVAMGLNECAGYAAVAVAAWLAAFVAGDYGPRAALFGLGLAFDAAGLTLSLALVRDTSAFARGEAQAVSVDDRRSPDQHLFAANQAGLVNNLNDGVAWGLFPLLFAAAGLGLRQIGALAAVYPAVWSVAQIAAGALSDRWGRKWLIATGMWVQAIAIWLTAGADRLASPYAAWLTASTLLGVGTALVYPTLLAAVSDAAHPSRRARAVGVYRLWRDLGYAVGALLSGLASDMFGVRTAITLVGAVTFGSGVIVAGRMADRQ
jgi:MFS family permease